MSFTFSKKKKKKRPGGGGRGGNFSRKKYMLVIKNDSFRCVYIMDHVKAES